MIQFILTSTRFVQFPVAVACTLHETRIHDQHPKGTYPKLERFQPRYPYAGTGGSMNVTRLG